MQHIHNVRISDKICGKGIKSSSSSFFPSRPNHYVKLLNLWGYKRAIKTQNHEQFHDRLYPWWIAPTFREDEARCRSRTSACSRPRRRRGTTWGGSTRCRPMMTAATTPLRPTGGAPGMMPPSTPPPSASRSRGYGGGGLLWRGQAAAAGGRILMDAQPISPTTTRGELHFVFLPMQIWCDVHKILAIVLDTTPHHVLFDSDVQFHCYCVVWCLLHKRETMDISWASF